MTFNKCLTSSLQFIILISFTSCTTEFFVNPEQNPTDKAEELQYPNVDERLWSYFEDFENEAAIRNMNIDLRALEISGVIEDIPEDGVAGTCQYGQHIHHVTIDLDLWNRASNQLKEMVIFHELGHCALERGHTESANSNGICLSIMNSGTTDCNVLYNATNKEYYLNELFSVL